MSRIEYRVSSACIGAALGRSVEGLNRNTMEKDDGGVDGDGAAGASGEATIADKVSTSAPEEDVAMVADATVPESTGQEPLVSAIETDGHATEEIVEPPAVRRKSHRPSLEVVEVKVDSFYDKTDFKRDLQVTGGRGHK